MVARGNEPFWPEATPASAFAGRRSRLIARLAGRPALIVAGASQGRNYPANPYPFRASSHFLYLVGRALAGAALLIDAAGATLFLPPPEPDDALWHGPTAGWAELEAELGLEVQSLDGLAARMLPLRNATAALWPQDGATASWLADLLGRPPAARASPADDALAEAMIALRLVHDDAAIGQLRQAAEATALAHAAGMRATRPGLREAHVCAAMEAALQAAGMTTAYGSIVTVHGEILHNPVHSGVLGDGDLLLADVGAETPEGWAGDVTRVWPVRGRFSGSQRAIYEVVLAAQRAAIERARAGVRYRAVHEAAAKQLIEGLLALGIFRGNVDDLLARGAHALFFPHGVGHLLGLDVHDMEDLGDRAGYAPGRVRANRFGDRYLRLDRDLVPGMAVTIEPGFYQVPAILEDRDLARPFAGDLDKSVLARYADVRGIRIEDDVLVTASEPEVLTASIPKEPGAVEQAMAQ